MPEHSLHLLDHSIEEGDYLQFTIILICIFLIYSHSTNECLATFFPITQCGS